MTAASDTATTTPSQVQAAQTTATTALTPASDLAGPYEVEHVIDGDTIIINGERGEEKIRFIGLTSSRP
jgi:endonuclease YncB( thermonuclease family)